MRQLHGHSGRHQPGEIVCSDLRRQQYERRSDALAARSEQVGHGGGDDIGICSDRLMQAGLDGSEVLSDRAKQARLGRYVACFSQSCTS